MDKIQEIRKALEAAKAAEGKRYYEYLEAKAHLNNNAPEWLSYLLSELENKEYELKMSREGWAEIHDELRAELDAAKKENCYLHEEIDCNHKKLKQALEALEWYADKENYKWKEDTDDPLDMPYTEVNNDGGMMARMKLSLIRGEESIGNINDHPELLEG